MEIGEELHSILLAFFRGIDIFVADCGKPGIRSDLAHLFAEEINRNLRIAREIYLRNRQARAVADLKLDFCAPAGESLLFD
jgi:hypothetical protein